MGIGKDIGKIIGGIALGIVVTAAMIYIVLGVGYLFGMALAILPFVGDWLTEELPVSTEQLPGIMAWVVVVGMIVGMGSKGKSKE